MLKEKHVYRHIAAAILSFALILSGLSFQTFAADGSGTVFKKLTLGTKTSITFDSTDSKFYKVDIPKKGLYRIDYYNTYHNSYNDDFWTGLYRTKSDAENNENPIDYISSGNSDNLKADYEIFNLNAGTYYLQVQCFDTARPETGIRVKAATDADLYALAMDYQLYAGKKNVYVVVGYDNPIKKKYIYGKVTSVTSSNSKVVKVVKETYTNEKGKKQYFFHLNYKKAGTAKLTVKYTRANGKKATIKETLKIKKYPNMIKSLKVNGKAVKVSKNKFVYSVSSFKKTSAKIKMATKNGWKVKEATVDFYGKSYSYKELKKSVITKGSSISIPKKYERAIVYIYMENKAGDQITYEVDFIR